MGHLAARMLAVCAQAKYKFHSNRATSERQNPSSRQWPCGEASSWLVMDCDRCEEGSQKEKLKASYIPLCLCGFLLDKLRVTYPLLWAVCTVCWTMARAGLVALTMWRISHEAVQPFLGCRSDMDMYFALHGSTLVHMNRLYEPAARLWYYHGDSPGT